MHYGEFVKNKVEILAIGLIFKKDLGIKKVYFIKPCIDYEKDEYQKELLIEYKDFNKVIGKFFINFFGEQPLPKGKDDDLNDSTQSMKNMLIINKHIEELKKQKEEAARVAAEEEAARVEAARVEAGNKKAAEKEAAEKEAAEEEAALVADEKNKAFFFEDVYPENTS